MYKLKNHEYSLYVALVTKYESSIL